MKPRRAAALTIDKVINEKVFSNCATAWWLMKEKWSNEDRRLYVRLVYGTLENMLLIDAIIEKESGRKIFKIDRMLKNVLRIAIYQLFFTERIPAYAAINEAVEMIKTENPKAAGFVNAILRGCQRTLGVKKEKALALEKYCKNNQTLRYSHAQWIVDKLYKDYHSDDVRSILEAHQRTPDLTIRLNLLKGNTSWIIKELESEGIIIEHAGFIPEAYKIIHSDRLITITEAYKNGLFQIQSIVSMLAVAWLDPQPGEVIVDVAAAPGGKTTFICQRMNDVGTLYARDVSPARLQQVSDHSNRLGCHIIKTQVMNGTKMDQRLEKKVDRVLVDAPCSGMGMIRKKPELKMIHEAIEFAELPDLQLDMLETSAHLVKPGGVLMYSTCTYFSDENKNVVITFLKKNIDFSLEKLDPISDDIDMEKTTDRDGMIQLGPHIHPSLDGFFVATLTRKKD